MKGYRILNFKFVPYRRIALPYPFSPSFPQKSIFYFYFTWGILFQALSAIFLFSLSRVKANLHSKKFSAEQKLFYIAHAQFVKIGGRLKKDGKTYQKKFFFLPFSDRKVPKYVLLFLHHVHLTFVLITKSFQLVHLKENHNDKSSVMFIYKRVAVKQSMENYFKTSNVILQTI